MPFQISTTFGYVAVQNGNGLGLRTHFALQVILQTDLLNQAELRFQPVDMFFFAFEYVLDRKSTRLNSSHVKISYAVFCLKKKKKRENRIIFTQLYIKYTNKIILI